MARTIGVRFRQAGKIFYYDAGDLEVIVGTHVVVETAHGLSVARVVISPDQVIANDAIAAADIKPVLRLATQEDMERMDEMNTRAHEALRAAKTIVSEQGVDISLANGEFDLDGSQFTAYFTATERVDFRGVVRDLSRDLGARVQLLQVGDRDRAKLTDGFDICGERLCCSSWMTNFPSVSIRMAKEQDLPLNPQKISGVCGRLYCCLTFEYDDYKALRGTLPKVGSFVSTPAGEAKVTGIDFNREVVKLWLTESREAVEVAAIDFRLQNGVTIRPMEIVRKIEGPLRTITEDTSGAGLTRLHTQRPGRSRPPADRPAQGGQRPTGDRPPQGGQRTPGGVRQSPSAGPQPGQPSTGRPSRPPRNRPPRGAQPPTNQQPPVDAAQTSPGAPEDGQKRRRRRRGRGRGRGPGGPAEGGPPTPPPASE